MSGNRGKYAEGKVKDFLEQWKQRVAAFTYNRILDAHSSKGAMSNPQPGDFQWFLGTGYKFTLGSESVVRDWTRNGLIEVKEVEHDFRLPYQNFAIDQVGRMTIREMAGSECIVLICHRTKGQRGAVWRQVPLSFFRERPGPKYGSWDVSSFAFDDSPDAFLHPYLS